MLDLLSLVDTPSTCASLESELANVLRRILVPGAGPFRGEAQELLTIEQATALPCTGMSPRAGGAAGETTEASAAILGCCHELGVRSVARAVAPALPGGAWWNRTALLVGDQPHALGGWLSIWRISAFTVAARGVKQLGDPGGERAKAFITPPDPPARVVCSIRRQRWRERPGEGHCLKYGGITANHVLELEVVFARLATITRLGGSLARRWPGLDLRWCDSSAGEGHPRHLHGPFHPAAAAHRRTV